MNMAKYLLVFGTLLSLGIADLATAQEEPQKAAARNTSRRRDEDLVTRVFQVKNIDLGDAFEVTKRVYGIVYISAVESNNTLIIRNTPETLDEIAQMLDQMSEIAPQVSAYARAQVYTVQHHNVDQIADMLSEVFRHCKIIPDSDSGKLLVSGSAAEVERIYMLMMELDEPGPRTRHRTIPRTLSITVDFIQATVGGDSGYLPENLQMVGEALLKNGLGDAEIYGHLMVRTQENEEFESNGVVRSDEDDSAVSFLRIRGNAEVIDGQVQLHIESNLQVPITQTRRDREGNAHTTTSYEDFGLSTTTTVPLGDYLVLGAMPASIEDSDTILMVIHITAD